MNITTAQPLWGRAPLKVQPHKVGLSLDLDALERYTFHKWANNHVELYTYFSNFCELMDLYCLGLK